MPLGRNKLRERRFPNFLSRKQNRCIKKAAFTGVGYSCHPSYVSHS